MTGGAESKTSLLSWGNLGPFWKMGSEDFGANFGISCFEMWVFDHFSLVNNVNKARCSSIQRMQ
jgi:hypothetical protein